MPDGTTSDHRHQAGTLASNSGPISHPLLGNNQSELATRQAAESTPPVNIKMTVPILGRRFYFAVTSGRERRGKERLALERQNNPMRTKSNILFIFVGAVLLYLLTLGSFLVYAAVLEP